MAMQAFFSPHAIIHQTAPLKKSDLGRITLRTRQLPVKKAAKLQISCSINNQVFEDHSTGVSCYLDDRGEIICEGLDEGPRLLPSNPLATYPLSDVELHDLLQQRCLWIMDEQHVKGSTLLGQHSCNGFNTLY